MTSGANSNKAFTDEYIERCFITWYSLQQPSNLVILQENIPESPEGKKPGLALLRTYKEQYGWVERADALNAKAIQKTEVALVDKRAEMFMRQIETALAVGEKAREQILADGFDSSASAVNALKWAQEEERTVRGVSEMMIKISKMTPDELMAEAAKLLKRNSEVIDIPAEELDVTDYDSDSA